MAQSTTVACQCEHEAHFDSTAEQDPTMGHSSHKYMQEFASSYVAPVNTIYGTYNMCKDCAHCLPSSLQSDPFSR